MHGRALEAMKEKEPNNVSRKTCSDPTKGAGSILHTSVHSASVLATVSAFPAREFQVSFAPTDILRVGRLSHAQVPHAVARVFSGEFWTVDETLHVSVTHLF